MRQNPLRYPIKNRTRLRSLRQENRTTLRLRVTRHFFLRARRDALRHTFVARRIRSLKLYWYVPRLVRTGGTARYAERLVCPFAHVQPACVLGRADEPHGAASAIPGTTKANPLLKHATKPR